MAKRFTDTEKWKKSFFRGIQGPYKLLWLYVLDDCDMSGVWNVDMEVASIRVGEVVTLEKALDCFGDRVQQFDDGQKWFLKDFVFFQYGELKPTNRMHLAVINLLKKYNLKVIEAPSEPLPRGQGQGQGQGIIQGQGEGQGQGAASEFSDGKPDDWKDWGQQIVDGNDFLWEQMKGREVGSAEMNEFLSVATRNDWSMKTQHAFRTSLMGFKGKNEQPKLNLNGKRNTNSAEQLDAGTVYTGKL